MYSAVIAEDEPLARGRLERLIGEHADLMLKASCADGLEAISKINKLQPDIIFLDIQMPGCKGFEVLNHLQCEAQPVIIFTTAFDSYAIQAFEYCALDYVLKPYKDERLLQAIERAIEQLQLKLEKGYSNRLSQISQFQHPGIDFEVLQNGVVKKIPSQQIQWIIAQGNYAEMHTAKENTLYRATVSSLEYRLQEFGFIRIHRSTLVNPEFLLKVRYLHANNQFEFCFMQGEKLLSGRSFKDRIAQWLQDKPELLTN